MNTTVAIALISAGAALFGSSIGLIGQVINNHNTRQLQIEDVKRARQPAASATLAALF
jgi:hypothetical protein